MAQLDIVLSIILYNLWFYILYISAPIGVNTIVETLKKLSPLGPILLFQCWPHSISSYRNLTTQQENRKMRKNRGNRILNHTLYASQPGRQTHRQGCGTSQLQMHDESLQAFFPRCITSRGEIRKFVHLVNKWQLATLNTAILSFTGGSKSFIENVYMKWICSWQHVICGRSLSHTAIERSWKKCARRRRFSVYRSACQLVSCRHTHTSVCVTVLYHENLPLTAFIPEAHPKPFKTHLSQLNSTLNLKPKQA